jgi:thiosulfate/3-mercaptopyruvate sulfurtransferase
MLTLGLLTGCGKRAAAGTSVAEARGASQMSHLISAAQLKELIDKGDKDLIIVGVINPAAALVPLSPSSQPIDGSYLVWSPDYSGGGSSEALSPQVTGYRKSKADMEALLSKAGVTPASKIVVYSADAMNGASRFLWQLRVLGIDNVKYLDGGINAWIAAGYPTGKGVRMAEQQPKSDFKAPDYNPQKFDASTEMVKQALLKPNEWVVLDTRSQGEYSGQRTGSSAGAFGTGRMKGAVHIEWNNALDPNTLLLKSKEELEAIYGNAIRGKKVIAHCQSGVRSAHTYLVLTEVLGAAEVYNYDGSWIEWSFAASDASGSGYADVLQLTEEWTDNKGPI